jgi:hypothetical protein
MSADEAPAQKIPCRRCNAVLDASDRYCRRCGCPIDGQAGGVADASLGPAANENRVLDRRGGRPVLAELAGPVPSVERARWWDNPWMILLLLFAVAGAPALPLLWRSRSFGRGWKIGLTVIVLIYTALLLWAIYLAIDLMMLKPLRDMNELMKY